MKSFCGDRLAFQASETLRRPQHETNRNSGVSEKRPNANVVISCVKYLHRGTPTFKCFTRVAQVIHHKIFHEQQAGGPETKLLDLCYQECLSLKVSLCKAIECVSILAFHLNMQMNVFAEYGYV